MLARAHKEAVGTPVEPLNAQKPVATKTGLNNTTLALAESEATIIAIIRNILNEKLLNKTMIIIFSKKCPTSTSRTRSWRRMRSS